MAEARGAAEERAQAERTALDARLNAAVPAFEVWLADEQRGAAKGPMPDPISLIRPAQRGEDDRLREDISALQSELAEAKAKENELGAAKTEITRLSGDLAALKAREALELAQHADEQRLRDEIGDLQRRLNELKMREGELDAAKAEIARLSGELAGLKAQTLLELHAKRLASLIKVYLFLLNFTLFTIMVMLKQFVIYYILDIDLWSSIIFILFASPTMVFAHL